MLKVGVDRDQRQRTGGRIGKFALGFGGDIPVVLVSVGLEKSLSLHPELGGDADEFFEQYQRGND